MLLRSWSWQSAFMDCLELFLVFLYFGFLELFLVIFGLPLAISVFFIFWGFGAISGFLIFLEICFIL